jgi:hypothetical protein
MAGVSIVLPSISETGEDATSSGGGSPGNPNLESHQATKELTNLTLQVTRKRPTLSKTNTFDFA